MNLRSQQFRAIIVVAWLVAALAVGIEAWIFPGPGWDLHVYANAIRSLQAGHDPYADGIAVQRAFHAVWLQHPDPHITPPFTYVYSPITLPVLRAVQHVPLVVSGVCYWALFAVGVVAGFWGCLFATTEKERHIFLLLAPGFLFFPGLIYTLVFLSGNLAYILYGLAFAAAVHGWRRGRWLWFYLIVVIASCYKAPLLSLIAVPVLSARRQVKNAVIAGAVGVALFLSQPHIWPTLFHNYLEAVELQFSFNHDFGLSPAGLLGNALFFHGTPYSTPCAIAYVVYGSLVAFVLWRLSRDYFAGRFTLQQWIPVMLIGVVLLNPRIKEYDIAALSLPMAIVVWRLFAQCRTMWLSIAGVAVLLAAVNVIGLSSEDAWKPTAGIFMVAVFLAGVWQLQRVAASNKAAIEANEGMTTRSTL